MACLQRCYEKSPSRSCAHRLMKCFYKRLNRACPLRAPVRRESYIWIKPNGGREVGLDNIMGRRFSPRGRYKYSRLPPSFETRAPGPLEPDWACCPDFCVLTLLHWGRHGRVGGGRGPLRPGWLWPSEHRLPISGLRIPILLSTVHRWGEALNTFGFRLLLSRNFQCLKESK